MRDWLRVIASNKDRGCAVPVHSPLDALMCDAWGSIIFPHHACCCLAAALVSWSACGVPGECSKAATLRRVYELRYFNIAENEGEDEE